MKDSPLQSLPLLSLLLIAACGSPATHEDPSAIEQSACTTAARVVAEPVNWPESPLYAGGTLKYVAYGSHQVWSWDGSVAREFWRQDGCGPSAIIQVANGDYFVTCYDSNSLAHLSPTGQLLENITQDSTGGAFKGPNDFARDSRGGFYFSVSGVFDPAAPVEGKVYYRAANGTIRKVADGIHYSNGLAVTDGGHSLLVAEHLEAQVLKLTIAADGSLSNRRVWLRVRDLVPTPANAPWSYGVDGIRCDSPGNVFLANYAGSRVLVVSPWGQLVTTIAVPYPFVDNMGLGPDIAPHHGHAAPNDEEFLYVSALKDDSALPYPGAIFQVRNPTH